jgi:molybdopterin-guanine dinucleotide biosynthesis protein A
MPLPAEDVAAFVLAGGKSTRMGTDKAFVTFEGQTLLERMLVLARSITNNVRIVGDATRYSRFAPAVQDVHPGCGPLGGIHAALESSDNNLNLILAVDIPFVPQALALYLIREARDSPAALVTVVRTQERWQPLCAVYRKGFLIGARKALLEGHYKIGDLFDHARTRVITDDDLEIVGFSPEAFRNLNTPQDVAAGRRGGI